MKKLKESDRRRFLRASTFAGLGASGLTLLPAANADAMSAAPRAAAALWPARTAKATGAQALPPPAFRVFQKLAFGPRPDNPANPVGQGDLDYFASLGASDEQRLDNWLGEQIAGGVNGAFDDPEVEARTFQNPAYQTLNKSLTELWLGHHRFEGQDSFRVRRRPYEETKLLMITRMVHSRWQLREVLADFWHNHFNVDGSENAVTSVLVQYDRDVIRPHIFGNFRLMLADAVKSTAMLYYLDNRQNATPNPNENYARELLELHTLGAVENYFGFTPSDQVPLNSDGQPKGYVEADVLEMARLLTGFGVADGSANAADTGEFLFRDARHDFGGKTVVGLDVAGSGESELDVMLDYLAAHRGTAEFICWKLVVRLIGEDFSASDPLVQQAADLFQATWQAPNQLEQVYRALILSETFISTWGSKAKRPIEIIGSALRAANVDFVFEMTSTANNAGTFGYMSDIERAGQLPFSYEPPTGYPEDRAIWQGTGPLIMSWRAITRMLRDTDSIATDQFANLAATTNASGVALTPNLLVDYWSNRILGTDFSLAVGKRDAIVAFVQTHGNAPDPNTALDLDSGNTSNDSEYQRVIRGLVLLLVLLPELMVR
ncbi:MAG: DUF1800 domain-containing protein [Xanthomonadaceae bacterium]|nr:DUF1800 domain-containing protein [Xanthomonadaceae bacterium]